jgi:hypothetical protein
VASALTGHRRLVAGWLVVERLRRVTDGLRGGYGLAVVMDEVGAGAGAHDSLVGAVELVVVAEVVDCAVGVPAATDSVHLGPMMASVRSVVKRDQAERTDSSGRASGDGDDDQEESNDGEETAHDGDPWIRWLLLA